MNYADIGVSAMKATNFSAIQQGTSGRCENKVTAINDGKAYTTQGDVFWVLGDITLKLNGLLYTSCDCQWNFVGVLSAADDFYNFNASTHRSRTGEAATTLGRWIGKACGAKPYVIKFNGNEPITQGGRMSGSPTCCGAP